MYTAMQELSNSKLSSAYLNGIKDSLHSANASGHNSDANHAIQDLLRAASLLGGFGFGAAGPLAAAGLSQPAGQTAKSASKSAGDGSGKTTSANDASGASNLSTKTTTPTPENGQTGKMAAGGGADSHRGNGKSSHDDTLASEDSGLFSFLKFCFPSGRKY